MLHSQSFTRNCILATLSAEDYALLQPALERIELGSGDELASAGQPIDYIYFLEGGVASVVTIHVGRKDIEVGLFGREGLCGIAAILRADRAPGTARMQIGGATALRIAPDRLVAACRQSETLLAVLLRYVQTTIIQTAHTAAANAHRTLPTRLARWLLMCHDRCGGDDLRVTHGFMAAMLAVDRSGLTVTLHILESTGAIRSRRGVVTIRDRALLEAVAGDSYGQPEAEYRRLVGPFPGQPATERTRPEPRPAAVAPVRPGPPPDHALPPLSAQGSR